MQPKHMPFRFHPAMPYWEDEVSRTASGNAGTVVRRGRQAGDHAPYIPAKDGEKPDRPYPKKFMPFPSDRCLTGGAVRLCQAEPVLGISEGIETTALAVRQATGMAVWAALSCTLLERVEPPTGTRHVAIWGDLDRKDVGKDSAQKLAKRLSAQGITASLHIPPASLLGDGKGVDWLDVLNRAGPAGFPSVV